jgi:hypothetical protein
MCSCSSKKIRSDSASDEKLFPDGTYRHAVQIHIRPGQENSRDFNFNGMVQISADWVKIVVLSPFGTTLSKITENRSTGEIQIENQVSSLKRFESKMREYYASLRILLLAPRAPSQADPLKVIHSFANHLPQDLEVFQGNEKIQFTIKKYDEHQVPEEVILKHPKFHVEIEVSGYEV